MKLLIDIPEQLYKDSVELDYMSPRCFGELKDAVKNGSTYGIEFPTGYATNGYVFETVYGQFIDILKYHNYEVEIVFKNRTTLYFPMKWWVSNYFKG